MFKSVVLFFFFLKQSIKELKNSYKIYFVYFICFYVVFLVQNGLDYFYIKNDILLKIMSKILFSTIPILISSKILYIMKIRHTGLGEYKTIVWKYLSYNIYYFLAVLLCALIYLIPAYLISLNYPLTTTLSVTIPLLAPLIYVMVYYSFAPYVAVFDDEIIGNVFTRTKVISSKNIFLVVVNHLFSLIIPILFSMNLFLENTKFKLVSAYYLTIPEALFSILVVLTTSKIYFYLLDCE